ncbi:DNA helicase [Colletotrichum tofieldiae]|nr:DNA helicase [Colletotrichum tofieldiae]GKT68820.1 DNA helicase [Colletotrichum tofieldiae]
MTGTWDNIISTNSGTVSITISMEPDETATKAEMAAITKTVLAKEGTIQYDLWQYTGTFADTKAKDMLTTFPSLRHLQEEEPSPYAGLYKSLSSLPAGMMVYTGGPGSGKTTFGLRMATLLAVGEDSKIIWTAHSNEICDDVASKLAAAIPSPDVVIARVHTIRRMMTGIAGRYDHWDAPEGDLGQDVSMISRAVSETIQQHARRRDASSPLWRADSLVHMAIKLATESPAFADIIDYRTYSDPSDHLTKEFENSAYNLIAATLQRVDILVGTPVALGQIGGCSKFVGNDIGKWNPDAIFVDEAGRMPEAQAWIPIATFDDFKLVVLMGDTRQFRPMSKSLDNNGQGEEGHKWQSTFGPQRTMSLLRRVEKVGRAVDHIHINRRNIGAIAQWTKVNIYNNQMNIRYYSGPLVDLFRDTVNKVLRLPDSTVNSYVVNVGEGEERDSSPSYSNDANRNYTFDLIFRLFRHGFPCTTRLEEQGNIMVITPYTAQLSAYVNDWDNYKVDDYTKQHVIFRTIDDSMSAEADIVILDTVRSEKLGFIPMTPRMAVATTRARGAMITLLNVKEWKKRNFKSIANAAKINHVISYFNWHLQHNAVQDTSYRKKGWTMLCTKCGGPNHLWATCKSQYKCPNKGCNENHDARYCPQGFKCKPIFKLRTDKKVDANPSITPGNTDTAADAAALKLGARRTRADILANTFNDEPIEKKLVPDNNIRQQMHVIYNILSAGDTTKDLPFVTKGYGKDIDDLAPDNTMRDTTDVTSKDEGAGTGTDDWNAGAGAGDGNDWTNSNVAAGDGDGWGDDNKDDGDEDDGTVRPMTIAGD